MSEELEERLETVRDKIEEAIEKVGGDDIEQIEAFHRVSTADMVLGSLKRDLKENLELEDTG